MPVASEHMTLRSRVLKYTQEIGWTYVLRDEAERQCNFELSGATPEERTRKPSLFFGGPSRQLMTAQLRVHALDLLEPTSFTAKDAR